MIIKKKKNNNIVPDKEASDNESNIVVEEAIQEAPEEKNEGSFILNELTEVKDREERRRGDRRRGYRRIEDRSLVSRAHEEAKIIKENAQKEGFDEGVNNAKEEVAELKNAIQTIIDIKEKAYDSYKDDIIFIALEIAKKILSEQVKVEPETVVEITSSVIKNLSKEDNSITITVNSADEEVMKKAIEEGKLKGKSNVEFSVITDDNVEQGSCMVKTQSGQIDARFSSQFAIIKKAFEEGI